MRGLLLLALAARRAGAASLPQEAELALQPEQHRAAQQAAAWTALVALAKTKGVFNTPLPRLATSHLHFFACFRELGRLLHPIVKATRVFLAEDRGRFGLR